MKEDIIHLVLYASQPDIQRACDEHWSTPEWKKPGQPELPDNVYLADGGWLYTFDRTMTTCPDCKGKR